jgi:hypothetical protein
MTSMLRNGIPAATVLPQALRGQPLPSELVLVLLWNRLLTPTLARGRQVY